MAVVGHDDHVVVGEHPGQIPLDLLRHLGRQLAVVEERHLEHLVQERLLDVAALDDRARVRMVEELRGHVGLQAPPDEVLARILGPEHRHHVHLAAEPRHVVGAGEDAAREVLLPQVAGRDQQLLRGLLHRLHVVVLVDDRLADHQDLQVLQALEESDHLVRGVALAEIPEEVLGFLRIHVEVQVEQVARAERDLGGEVDAAAAVLDRAPLVEDLAGEIVLRVEVVAPLDVHRGADLPDDLLRGGRLGDRHVPHAAEGRHRLGAQALVEHGTARPLVDEPVGGDGHHQHVALGPRGLEVADVPGVDEVEDPVALDDLLPRRAQLVADRHQLGERLDLVLEGPRRHEKSLTHHSEKIATYRSPIRPGPNSTRF